MSQLNFVFGLGLFLFGMSQLEYGIRKLSDARLRKVLRTSTGSKLGSVATGVVTTAILQSSSMVSLLVLAFASAGLVPLVNAIGIILGANLGTTFTGWIVAIFGFKLDLEAIALPMLGIAGFVMAISARDTRINYWAIVAFGIALLLFGLGIMKTSMETLPERWDVSILQGHHPVVYLLFGVVITFLVQSSSAVMMMALAALNAGFVALPEAVALIIGADLGTTSTTALGSLTGSSIKRQLAFAHFSFNFIVDITAFIVMLPLLPALMSLLSLEDPLYSLVAFHSIMNLLGLLAFIPFLKTFAAWIEKLFSRGILQSASVLERVAPEVVEAALIALHDTVKQLMLQAACNSLRLFGLKPEKLKIIDENRQRIIGNITHQDFSKGYQELKDQEGNILNYSMKIQAQPLEPEQAMELAQLQMVTRHAVFANKNLKDIQQDLQEFKLSSSTGMRELYEMHKQFHKNVYEQFIDLLLGDYSRQAILDQLEDIHRLNDRHTEACNQFVQDHIGKELTEDSGLSIQFNANREIRHGVKTLAKSIDIWARMQQLQDPAELPAELVVAPK